MRDKTSIKRVELCHPKARKSIIGFIEEAEEGLNITLRIAEGLRSIEYQNNLYNQPFDGKDNDGDGKIDEKDEKVTNAPGGKSYHNYGLAIDLVEIKDGKANWDHFDYEKLLPYANKYGFKWGGLFRKFVDFPHFEKSYGYTVHELFEKYKKKDFIENTNYVKI